MARAITDIENRKAGNQINAVPANASILASPKIAASSPTSGVAENADLNTAGMIYATIQNAGLSAKRPEIGVKIRRDFLNGVAVKTAPISNRGVFRDSISAKVSNQGASARRVYATIACAAAEI